MRKNLAEVSSMLKSFQINNFNSINEPIIFSMETDIELTAEFNNRMSNFKTIFFNKKIR